MSFSLKGSDHGMPNFDRHNMSIVVGLFLTTIRSGKYVGPPACGKGYPGIPSHIFCSKTRTLEWEGKESFPLYSLTSVDKICTDYSWSTLDGLYMDYRWTTLMADYILDVCSGAIAGRL